MAFAGSRGPRPDLSDDLRRFWLALHMDTPRAWVTPALVVTNVAVFIGLVAAGASPLSPSSEIMIAWGANFGPLTASGEWWRLVAATFLHFGVFHLGLNMWALWDAGRLTERLYGNLPYLVVYLGSGVAASLASLLGHPHGVVGVGASGAVFGVLGALLAFLVIQRHSVPATVLKGLRASALAFVVYSLAFGFIQPGIDNAAHLGGLACGALLGAILARPLLAAERGRQLWIRMPLALAAAALLFVGLVRLVPPPAYDYSLEKHMQQETTRFAMEEEAILGAWKEAVDKHRAGTIDDAELARQMQALAGRWAAAAERFAQVRLSEASPSRERWRLLLRYAELRRDSARLIAEAFEEQDSAKMDQARELTAEMERVRDDLNQLATGPKRK
jgi:membrane associated rhomboid family serine protease